MHYQLLSVQYDIMTVPLSWVACLCGSLQWPPQQDEVAHLSNSTQPGGIMLHFLHDSRLVMPIRMGAGMQACT